MVRLEFSIQLAYQVGPPGADFIFSLQAAHTRQQQVVTEALDIWPQLPIASHTDPITATRMIRLQAPPGPLTVRHTAVVDLHHQRVVHSQLAEVPVARLPPEVLPFLLPSRYCPSDRLHRFAVAEFGGLWQGYGRVQAICDWVHRHVRFQSNTTNASTSALDTLVERVGVCRDFAHLMVALCRAVNIPARFTTGIDYGADPALGPTDFHAYVEVYLGHGWWMFDPSGTAIPMGFVRIATGRDAADAAFAMLFGSVTATPPLVTVAAIANAQGERIEPHHLDEALSTDADGL